MCSEKRYKEIKENGHNTTSEASVEIKESAEKMKEIQEKTEQRLRFLLL